MEFSVGGFYGQVMAQGVCGESQHSYSGSTRASQPVMCVIAITTFTFFKHPCFKFSFYYQLIEYYRERILVYKLHCKSCIVITYRAFQYMSHLQCVSFAFFPAEQLFFLSGQSTYQPCIQATLCDIGARREGATHNQKDPHTSTYIVDVYTHVHRVKLSHTQATLKLALLIPNSWEKVV